MRSIIKNLFLLVALTLTLSGCALFEEKPPVVVYKTVVLATPDNLLVDCPIPPPPDKDVYLAASPKDREKMLIELADKNIKNTALCNVDKAKARQWKKEQLERHKPPKGE